MTLVKTVFLTVKVIDININNGASKLNLFSKLHLVTERNTMVIKIKFQSPGKERKKKPNTQDHLPHCTTRKKKGNTGH